jgi:small subunit ribosomal protein S16
MLAIRLLRIGKKNQPSFKIVVTDKRKSPRAGRFVEVLGFSNPLTKKMGIKKDRVEYWLKVGAQPSDSVRNILIENKIIEGKKIAVNKKSKKTKEAAPATPSASSGQAAPAAVAVPAAPSAGPAKEAEKPKEEAKPAEPAVK